jgi:hypothetical protein
MPNDGMPNFTIPNSLNAELNAEFINGMPNFLAFWHLAFGVLALHEIQFCIFTAVKNVCKIEKNYKRGRLFYIFYMYFRAI